jgi:universal stress protein A
MFSRILVPTDFSPPSDAALDYARILAAKFGSALQVLHVIDDPTAASEFVPDGFAASTDSIRAGLVAHSRERLDALVTAVDRARYHAHIETLFGGPAQTIVDYALAVGAGLIVMGTHGRTGLAHLLMGSVAEQVVRTAPCPVLTVRQVAVAEDALLDTSHVAAVRHVAVPVAV